MREIRNARSTESACCRSRPLVGCLRKIGWLALAGFTAKGLLTTSLILWVLISAAD